MIEVLSNEISMGSNQVEEGDHYIYIRLSAYFMCLFRRFAYEKKLKAQKAKKQNVRLQLNLNLVGPALQIGNIDYVFSQIFRNCITTKKSDIKFSEFIAGIEYFHELLLLIRDMASSKNEKMKKNA